MRIVIAGAGAVGTHLAKLLSGERQDIVLIDENDDILSSLSSSFDLLTIVASPTSVVDLKNAGVEGADLFIAVTPDESRNLISCQLAHNIGAKKTLARIDNHEYLMQKNREFFVQRGVDSLIYPEMLAAQELIDGMKQSWIRQWWEFCDGALVMMGVKIRENAEILNVPFHDLTHDIPYHIVAIKRGNDTIIPNGSDMILMNDLVYFMTTKKHISYIRKIAGKQELPDIRDVIIMGGSRIVVRAALMLPAYMRLKIIESSLEKCNRLRELLDDKIMIINGDGRDPNLLLNEGIDKTEAFVALTDSSETNILACLAAKRFGVTKTIAEVENIDYISLAENLDIGTVINKKKLAASHIFQMLLDADVSNVKCLTFANADVAEFKVKKGAKVTKNVVKDLNLPKYTTIGGLIRDNEGMRVSGNTQIIAGDHVVVFCMEGMIKKLEKYFN
ncbi:MAG TPA: Trk system potassium transporter TrkA [Bacteroidaceae bacterium]|nr:Trk system potassium transporter TrkA [Bacteroidaceae bacterium]